MVLHFLRKLSSINGAFSVIFLGQQNESLFEQKRKPTGRLSQMYHIGQKGSKNITSIPTLKVLIVNLIQLI